MSATFLSTVYQRTTRQYKIVWGQNDTQQFFDGALVGTLETNVPSVPSYFVWNSVSAYSRTAYSHP